ncbi:MAG: hypothetical protein ACI8Y6_002160 [Brevundimonas sp.]|jgi:hypothetical protein
MCMVCSGSQDVLIDQNENTQNLRPFLTPAKAEGAG